MKIFNLTYFWTAIWVAVGLVCGFVPVIVVSVFNNFNWGLLILWSLAYYVIGGLTGFIFSVPKVISEDATSAALDNSSTRTNVLKRKYEDNTNLTQISDWLTKILIGAGLVELKEIPGFVLKVGSVMGNSMQAPVAETGAYNYATIFCVGIILYFVTWGFISGYIVMKLILTEQFVD